PVSGTGGIVTLGSFTNDRGLEAGLRYTRTEQVRLPSKIEGIYRIQVVTNSNLGGSGTQTYEHGAARNNNKTLSDEATYVSLNPRPDLRIDSIEVPDSVTAGGMMQVSFVVSNMGPEPTSGQWTDKVYLSLDGILSGDDILAASVVSSSALNPGEQYRTVTATFEVPLRYRQDVYVIVQADANNRIDEYPQEGNNTRAQKLHVTPVPFSVLVTSKVMDPDQAVHGSTIQVDYKVSNLGSATTQGNTSAVKSWTDSVWLTVDKRRPSAGKGDILLGTFTHEGHLEINEDYLASVNVKLPEN